MIVLQKSIVLIIVLVCIQNYFIKAERIFYIGLILNGANTDEEIAFRSTIDRVNVYERDFQLYPVIKIINIDDSYQMEKIACEFIAQGVIAIFGPSSDSRGIVSSICNHFDIPHIVFDWMPEEPIEERHQRSMSLNVYPNSVYLTRGYADIVKAFEWSIISVTYEKDEDFIKLQDVIQLANPGIKGVHVTVTKLGDKRDQELTLKKIKNSGENCVILHCDDDRILDFLLQATHMKIMDDYQSFFLSNLDSRTIDFSEMNNTKANITTISVIDPADHEVINAINDWERSEKMRGRSFHIFPQQVKIKMALIHDGIRMFAKALKDLHIYEEMSVPSGECNRAKPWSHGRMIFEFMKNITFDGITGRVEFNKYGERIQFTLRLLQLRNGEFFQLTTWDPVNKLSKSYTQTPEFEQHLNITLQNKIFKVVSRLGQPYLIEKTPAQGEILEGNARYEGYSLDLIDNIAKTVGFKYEFFIARDNRYGSLNKEKKWDGLVREILEKKADLAICDLTITLPRRKVMDFSVPFMSLGIGILYSKPIPEDPKLFSFTSPFSLSVWLYMATAYLTVSILLFALARMAPDDWENPHPCNEESEELENIWGLANTTWLTMGSIMGQGCDILPKSISTRLVTGMWWFFALMMLNSYTANLAAFLTSSRSKESIETVEQLAAQRKVKYGLVAGGSTQTFFQETNESLYGKMWSAMENEKPSVFEEDNNKGIERVIKSKGFYAFFMESTMIEYTVERKCDLMQIGKELDSKSYGIGMPFNSPYRSVINSAILKLSESGRLYELKKTWWREKLDTEPCTSSITEEGDANRLTIQNVGGVFLVLGCGIFVAVLIGIMEFLWNVRKIAVEEKIAPLDALRTEVLFALKFWIASKPAQTSSMSEYSPSKRSSKSQAGSETRSMNHSNLTQSHNMAYSMKSLQSDRKDTSYLIRE